MATMDFFGHQDRARRASNQLVGWFVLAVVGVTAGVYFAAVATLQVADSGGGWWQPEVLLATAGATVCIVGLASLYKIGQLRSGGKAVAKLLGGRAVDPQTKDAKERTFANIVEEMSIASGTPMPAIYVLDGEPGINAFAAGWSTGDAVVAVTRGCLEKLDRDELQGVVAHEFSHIFHGDMRLNIRIMGVLFGIVCIATIGRILLRLTSRSGGDGKKGAAGLAIFGLSLLVVGGLGVMFSRLIQAAISRQREYLADASAVQYTRNPRGIGMALAKIGGYGAKLQSAQVESASHMLFADGMARWIGGAFATHPPLPQRIERVLPGFRKQLGSGKGLQAAVERTPGPAVAGASGFAPGTGLAPRAVVAAVGVVGAAQVAAARELLSGLPLELTAAAHDPQRAAALVLALLLDGDAGLRRQQLAGLGDEALGHEAALLHGHLRTAARRVRLPLLDLAIGTLRPADPTHKQLLRERARRLAIGDGRLSLFEFAVVRTLEHHLLLPGERPQRPSGRPDSLLQHAGHLATVLSVVARAAADDETSAQRAFGQAVLALGSGITVTMQPPERARAEDLEVAVTGLQKVSPLGKRNLLNACAEAAGADGVLKDDEIELLRVLAGLWDCPIPLVLDANGLPLQLTA